jgi:hypothetical protein
MYPDTICHRQPDSFGFRPAVNAKKGSGVTVKLVSLTSGKDKNWQQRQKLLAEN